MVVGREFSILQNIRIWKGRMERQLKIEKSDFKINKIAIKAVFSKPIMQKNSAIRIRELGFQLYHLL